MELLGPERTRKSECVTAAAAAATLGLGISGFLYYKYWISKVKKS